MRTVLAKHSPFPNAERDHKMPDQGIRRAILSCRSRPNGVGKRWPWPCKTPEGSTAYPVNPLQALLCTHLVVRQTSTGVSDASMRPAFIYARQQKGPRSLIRMQTGPFGSRNTRDKCGNPLFIPGFAPMPGKRLKAHGLEQQGRDSVSKLLDHVTGVGHGSPHAFSLRQQVDRRAVPPPPSMKKC